MKSKTISSSHKFQYKKKLFKPQIGSIKISNQIIIRILYVQKMNYFDGEINRCLPICLQPRLPKHYLTHWLLF